MPRQTPSIVAARTDAVRIVPLHAPEAHVPLARATPAAPPQLTYRQGPLLANVEVVPVYWGAAWKSGEAALAKRLNAFFDAILKSSLMTQLAEYSVPGYAIGRGKRLPAVTLVSPAPRRAETDASIRHLLQENIAGTRALPPPGPNVLYFVYLPPGVRVTQGGSASCQAFCGYHDHVEGQIFYAVMPYPGCAGCTGGLEPFAALTSTSSHELCEAITDPVPGRGWYDDLHGEIGDICAWKTKTVAGYTVQLEWSNRAGKCV
jgi:hypothetical protein